MALPFFNRFPYTNIGDINLDWIIKQVKILTKRVEELDPEDITERLNQVEAEAEQASVDAASAAGSASDAAASAASAVTAATAAQTTANAAQTTANAAQTTANAAQTAANTANTAISNLPSSSTPLVDGTASAGTSSKLSRADHVHPKDIISVTVSFSELPYTNNNLPDVTSDMAVIGWYLPNTRFQGGTWTIETGNGSISISGDYDGSGSSTLTLYLTRI